MIKECTVTLNNDVVTVAKYGDTYVQFPSIQRKAKTVFVECIDGRYSITTGKNESTTNHVRYTTKTDKKKRGIHSNVDDAEIIIGCETDEESCIGV